MQLLRGLFALLVLGVLCTQGALAQNRFGTQGPESEPDRMQQWLVPSPDPDAAAHAILFRPPGDGPFRLALIAHASTQNPLRRAQMPQSEYRALAAFLVARGFAVLVLNYLRGQSFVRQDGAVILGHSAGAWGALALAGDKVKGVSAIIAFAAGRGGHADDLPNQVCAPQRLLATAREFGKGARVPVTWLVAANDAYFSPGLSRQLAEAFRSGGGSVDFHVLAASGSEGHWLAETDSVVAIAGRELDRALKLPTAAKKQ